MARIHNFGAGPAQLPLPVLEKVKTELLDFGGHGMSIMEMSHRSKVFSEVHAAAKAGMRSLMNISEDYEILFLQGGASNQFAMIPLNLRGEGQSADYIHTGSWSAKAIKEAKVAGAVNVVWDGKDENYMRMPKPGEYTLDPKAAYAHICTNETIGGIRYPEIPTAEAPLIADMSSEIMSRVMDVSKFGMIYAGAQKNLGPSGMAVVIIRKDLIERSPETAPLFHRYKTHAGADSLYNTPNTWGIYILKLVTDWLQEMGGVAEIEKINEAKAAKLYELIDSSDFWSCPVDMECRSTMNVVWRLPNEELEARFVSEAKAAGLDGLKGHRSVGGLRASIYNACPEASVAALIDFMQGFEQAYG